MGVDLKRLVPKHYFREYPILIEFLQLCLDHMENDSFKQLKEQRDSHLLGREHKPLQLSDGLVLSDSDGVVVQLSTRDNKDLDMTMSERGFEDFVMDIFSNINGFDKVRFVKLLPYLKNKAGNTEFTKIFFSWLFTGDIEIIYPKRSIFTLEENCTLDNSGSYLRDDYYYSEFCYVVRVEGEPLFTNSDAFFELYVKHFHPAGFGFFVERKLPSHIRPFDFPILVPSGESTAYMEFTKPLVVNVGESVYIRALYDTSLQSDMSGNIFDNVFIEGDKLIFSEQEWLVTVNGNAVFNGYVIRSNGFLDLNFKRLNSTINVRYLHGAPNRTSSSGKLPINNIKLLNEKGRAIKEYRLNTRSTVGFPLYGKGLTMLPMKRGILHFDEEKNIVITDPLKVGTTYMLYLNSPVENGKLSFGVGSIENISDYVRFENAADKLNYLVNLFLPFAIKDSDTLPPPPVPQDPSDSDDFFGESKGEIDMEEGGVFYKFFTVEPSDLSDQTSLIGLNLGATTIKKLQAVVYETTNELLLLRRKNVDYFEESGYWYLGEEIGKGNLPDVMRIFSSYSDEFAYFMNFTLPYKTRDN